MPDQDLFKEQNEQQTTPPSSPEDLLKNITREDGAPKYETIEKALEGLAASQAHIAKLEAENKAARDEVSSLREQTQSQEQVKELLERVTSQTQNQEQVTPEVQGLDEEKARAIVMDTINQQQQAATAEANVNKVQTELINRFGDKAREQLNQVASGIGMTPEELGELAKTKPDAVLAFFKTNQTSTPAPAPTGNAFSSSPQEVPLGKPEKSLLLGASSADLSDYINKVKAEVYKEYDVTT